MPPRYKTKKSSASTSGCRRSKRISSRLNTVSKEELPSLKRVNTKSEEKLPSLKKVKKKSKEESPSLKEQPSSSVENPSKKIRLMETDEIIEQASQIDPELKQDFSEAIKRISAELSPDLEISKEAIVDMNAYLNHVYEIVVRQSAILPLARNSACITIKDIEAAVSYVVNGDLSKYCIAEGRRAVKQWNESEYVEAYK